MDRDEFRELVWQRGRELYRDMPWRRDTRGYYVLVSELMLQQTQVDRVIPKFAAFIEQFPDENALARATLAEVLTLWNGLGYNRRAKFLHEAVRKIVNEYQGIFPADEATLRALPGVGKNTAGAVLAYTYNQPAIFIETNIRTVYFHHFFAGKEAVSDAELMPLMNATLDKEHPREFYWALMDYGTFLKKQGVGRPSQSLHYRKQSALKGSVREVRGQIIRMLAIREMTSDALRRTTAADGRFETALRGLVQDGLIQQTNGYYHLTK